MGEIGHDISANRTKSVVEFLRSGTWFHFIITVCDEASAERCPIFPGVSRRLHGSFADPSALTGTPEETLERTREIRGEILARVQRFCAEECAVVPAAGA